MIYVADSSKEEVETKVHAWNDEHQLLTVMSVEYADDYPGYTVAVDGWTALETDVRAVAVELAAFIRNADPTWVIEEQMATGA